MLATRFRRPWPIVWGILIATVANHALASLVGAWVVQYVGRDALRWILGLSFLAMALWTLVPDSAPQDDSRLSRHGVFIATAIAFFVVEMGDKTQIATVALAAQFQLVVPVVIGTSLGMLIANVPVVFAGEALLRRVPLKTARLVASLTFTALASYILLKR